jgi:hypothetical protein
LKARIVKNKPAEQKKKQVYGFVAILNSYLPKGFLDKIRRFNSPSAPAPLKSVAGSEVWKPRTIH